MDRRSDFFFPLGVQAFFQCFSLSLSLSLSLFLSLPVAHSLPRSPVKVNRSGSKGSGQRG